MRAYSGAALVASSPYSMPARAAVLPDLGRADAEQRPREVAVARPHAREAARRRVLGQPVEHRLRLVVAVVRGDDDVVAVLRGELARAAVPLRAGARLEVLAGEPAAQALHVQRHAGGRAGALDDQAVAVGVGAAQAVVHVQRRERQTEAEAAVRRRARSESSAMESAPPESRSRARSPGRSARPGERRRATRRSSRRHAAGRRATAASERDDPVAAHGRLGEVVDGGDARRARRARPR